MMNPYSVLGVSRDADEESIKKAYKRLARKYHPDVSKEPDADERFKEVNAAFDILKDPEKKRMYDTFGTTEGPPPGFGGGGPGFGPGGPGGPFGGGFESHFEGGGVDLEDVLSSMFGAGGPGFGRRTARGRDQRTTLDLDPMLAITGGETTVVVARGGGQRDTLRVRIPAGVEDGKSLRLRGQGAPPPGGGPAGDLLITLRIPEHPLLRRRGRDLELDVPITVGEAVNGAEVVVPTPTGDVRVRVPAGASNGQKLRLRGRGVQADEGKGDLYLILRPELPPVEGEGARAAIDALEQLYPGPVRAGLEL